MIEPYQAVVVQACIQEPRRDEDMLQQMRNNIWRQIVLFRRFKFSYGRVRLIVMPELSAHGLDIRRSRQQMLPFALEIPGPEFDLYAMAAAEFGVYVAACTWERDKAWPDTYFLTGFVINPRGEVILKQRMINGALQGSTTTGMHGEIERVYGEEGPFGTFPVVDTEIGKLGVCVGGDMIQMESTRTLAMRGAEVIIHPMGERNMETSTHLAAGKRMAAFHNQCYFISANIGQYLHQHYREPAPSNDELVAALKGSQAWGEFEFMGRSQIIDPSGQMLAFIPAAGESATGAVIDVERLRADRQRRGWTLSMRGEAMAREYERFGGAPHDGDTDWERNARRREETLARMQAQGVLRKAEAYAP